MTEGDDREPPDDPLDGGTPEQYSVSFSKAAGRAEAVVTAWTGSLALLLVVALLPMSGTIQRIARVKEKVDEAKAAQARNVERRASSSASVLLALPTELAALLDQMISLEIRAASGSSQPGDEARLAELRTKFSAVRLPKERSDEIDTLRKRELDRRLTLLREASEIRGRRSREAAEQVALRRQITNTPTPIGPIPVPALLVPAIWLVLAGGLLTYVAVRRRTLLAILGKWVFASNRRRSGGPGVVPDAPFWLAPLPVRMDVTGEHQITAAQITRFIGWPAGGRAQLLGVAFCVIAGLLVSAWVGWIAVTSGTYHTDPHTGLRVTAMGILTIGGSWIAAALLWFAPLAPRAADCHDGLTRRHVIGVSVGALLAAYLLSPRSLLPSWATANARRFRRPREPTAHPTELAGTFVLHTGSGVVHYLGAGAVHPSGTRLDGQHLLKLDEQTVEQLIIQSPEAVRLLRKHLADAPRRSQSQGRSPDEQPGVMRNLPTPRVHPSQLGAVVERLALDRVAGNRRPDAIHLLSAGLAAETPYRRRAGRPPNYRLYDLWARLVLTDVHPSPLNKLSEHIRKYCPDDPVLAKRLAHWERLLAERRVPQREPWSDSHQSSPFWKRT